MVSENQSENVTSAPLQSLQFPSMIASENIVKKKLKIKITSKRIEVNPGIESCEFGQQVFMNDERHQSIPPNDKKSEMNKSHKLVISSSGDRKLYAADNLKIKSAAMGSLKRGLPGVGDGQKEKRRKMDRSVTQQCSSILKQLMTHPSGWVFNHPVDPVKLNIPDYFAVISEPMDLGTIKSKLTNNKYCSVEEFAADVRLTFSNAMVYNPPANEVHLMAKKLNNIFNTRWNSLEAKWNHGHGPINVEQGHTSNRSAKNMHNTGQSGHKTSPMPVSLLPKNLLSAEEKQKLRKQLFEVSRAKMPPHLQGLLKKFGFNCQREGRIEVDIDAFDEETLWELKRIIRSSLGAKAAKAEPAKKTQNGKQQSIGKIIHKGTDGGNKRASGSANVNLPLNLETSNCGSCGSMRRQCSLQSDYARASSSDLSSEISLEQNHHDASRRDCEAKALSASQMSKSDLDSDGAVSALDEHIGSSPQLSILATTGGSGEGWTPLIDIQLSPKKALRAAMLKRRFADTILKAKQKTLLDHGDKADPVKMQLEKERLERQQNEEKARIEAQIRADEAASRMRAQAELKMQREREREAARLALQKMEKTVEIDDNLEILKDLEMLSRCSVSYHLRGSEGPDFVMGPTVWGHFGNALERLGLFMKDDYIMGDEDDEEAILNGDGEEGEICS